MGNETKWSLHEVFAGMYFLNYLDKTKGLPGDEAVQKLIPLLMVVHGTELNNLLFTYRQYERPLHIVKESGQDVDILESIVQDQLAQLPIGEQTMLEVFSKVLRDAELSKS